MACLIVTTGPRKGDFYRLGQRTNVIGRDETLPIQILDKHISRKHMELRFDKDHWCYSVLDMNSKHGVLINGTKIDKETVLNDHDYITVGSTTLLFTIKDFFDRQSALNHAKKVGQRLRPTAID
jgi:pSer/pThr/pTyr-binding forkhead associated (FHA) protein